MNIINKKIDEVIPYVNNPRNNAGAVDKVAMSIKEFGFKVPIVIDLKNEIITGHTRVLAAKQLGLSEVPCIVADDLSDEQVKAFRIADNRVAEFSEWDADLLLAEIEDLGDMFTGFDVEELKKIDLKGAVPDKPEVEFTEELLEEHNYVVLYFDNQVDWLQAQTLFDLKSVKALDSKEGYEKIGVGRVLNGAKAIRQLKGEEIE